MFATAKLQAMVATARPDQAKSFYGGVLGLKLLSEDQFALVYAGGDGEVRVSKVPAVSPSAIALVNFSSADVAANAKALSEAGARIERFAFLVQDAQGIWTAPDGTKVIWFRDPDGNLLSATQTP